MPTSLESAASQLGHPGESTVSTRERERPQAVPTRTSHNQLPPSLRGYKRLLALPNRLDLLPSPLSLLRETHPQPLPTRANYRHLTLPSFGNTHRLEQRS